VRRSCSADGILGLSQDCQVDADIAWKKATGDFHHWKDIRNWRISRGLGPRPSYWEVTLKLYE